MVGEKRSVIVIRQDDYDDWPGARSMDGARSFPVLPDAATMEAAPAMKS
jgi:hypothetical protein